MPKQRLRFFRFCLLGTIFAVFITSAAHAAEQAKTPAAPHITDFSLGLPEGELALRPVSECGKRLCGEVLFGGKVWNAAFTVENGKLKALSLNAPADFQYMEAALHGFEESPYVIHSAISDTASFKATNTAYDNTAFASFLRDAARASTSFASFIYKEKETSANATAGASLVLGPAGITVLVMNFQDLQQEIKTRMMRVQVAGDRVD